MAERVTEVAESMGAACMGMSWMSRMSERSSTAVPETTDEEGCVMRCVGRPVPRCVSVAPPPSSASSQLKTAARRGRSVGQAGSSVRALWRR